MNDFQLHTQSTKSNGFRWMNADAYLFDIDGTLLISRDRVHRNALHRRCARHTASIPPSTALPITVRLTWGSCALLWSALEFPLISLKRIFPQRLKLFAGMCQPTPVASHRRFAPQFRKCLMNCGLHGKLLGVASGNLESVGWLKLEAAGLRGIFQFWLLQRPSRKP